MTLCTAFIGQHLREKGKLTNLKRRGFSRTTDRTPIQKPVHVYIEHPTANECEGTNETEINFGKHSKLKPIPVYIGKSSDTNQWKKLGVTKGLYCSVICDLYTFMLAWGEDKNSVLLIRFKFHKEGKIIKMIQNVDELHVRHLYFNNFLY